MTDRSRMNLSSPCIRICELDSARKNCMGCGRTIEEIGQWLTLDDVQRQFIRKQLASRLKTLKGNA